MSEFRRPYHQTTSAFSAAAKAYFSAVDLRSEEFAAADRRGDLEKCDQLQENVATAYNDMVSSPADTVHATMLKLLIIMNEYQGDDGLTKSGVCYVLDDLQRLTSPYSHASIFKK